MQNDVDSIIQSGNLYVYCGNNPIMYIDPSGLDRAYIFYGPHVFGPRTGRDLADAMRSQLTSRYDAVILVRMYDFNQFQTDWENMEDAKFVAIIAHGDWNGMLLYSGYTAGRRDREYDKFMHIRDIESLSVRPVGVLVLISCNTGNDARGDTNVARAFMSIGDDFTGVRAVVAPSGYAHVYRTIFRNLRTRDADEGAGFMLFTRGREGTIRRQVLFNNNRWFNTRDLYRELRNRGLAH